MDHLGLNAASFSAEIGVQRSSISHILSGRNQPSFDFLVKISAKYPQINTDWLLTGKGNILKQAANSLQKEPIQQTLFSDAREYAIPGTAKNKTVKNYPVEKSNRDVTNVNSIERVMIFYKNGTFSEYRPASDDQVKTD